MSHFSTSSQLFNTH